MKVLLINHFPLEGSGSGTYTRDLAHYLMKKGHEVCIVFPENKEPHTLEAAQLCPVYFNGCDLATDSLPFLAADSLPFNFPCFTTHPRSTTVFSDLSQDELDAYLAVFDKTISDAVESFHPDIIHAQHIWLLSYLASRHQLPCVITAHGTDLMGYEKWPEFRRFANEAADACDCVITISRDNFRATVDTFPQIQDKTALLSNGYNDEIFYPRVVSRPDLLASYGIPYRGERIVFFAGKLTVFKGVDVLLHAVKKYETLHPDAIITIIAGSGEEDGNLRRLAQELGLKSVYFIGHQSQAELCELSSASDLFVIPSRYEAFGLVALEAMACGLPVVATDKGGLSDFVTDEVGALTTCDADALCAAILEEVDKAEDHPERRAHVARYALDHYSMVHYIEDLEKIYLKVLADRRQ